MSYYSVRVFVFVCLFWDTISFIRPVFCIGSYLTVYITNGTFFGRLLEFNKKAIINFVALKCISEESGSILTRTLNKG